MSRMTLSNDTIVALAPDQASLKAATKLMKGSKWPLRQLDDPSNLVWGECQGSGANPYRVVFDRSDHGYKCTCPSRKFPCKHALALMMMYVEGPGEFSAGSPPDWVTDWLGRRRKTGTAQNGAANSSGSKEGKSLALAQAAEPEKPEDPKAIARREAAAKKRAEETEAALLGAMDDLETWIEDQLRTGLGGLLGDLQNRCRAIAARMVDGKAGALAGRIDELPSQILALPGEERLDALIGQLGKLVILTRAFRADPKAPDVRRAVATSENRETILDDKDALQIKSTWEVAGERISTRRDGLVSQATWLMNMGNGPRFALLLDFFPATIGKRSSAFANGEQFQAELVFYPARTPLRALIAGRTPSETVVWPEPPSDPLAAAAAYEAETPWELSAPIMLPDGRIGLSQKGEAWWSAASGDLRLPMDTPPPSALLGMSLTSGAALWDGARLSLLSAQTDWGRVALDG